MTFVRFPRTPHLAWLGSGQPRDDKVLANEAAAELVSHVVTVEEKVDGANLGISLGPGSELRMQNRGSYLDLKALHPQFKPLRHWLAARHAALVNALAGNRILFGEWCYARHSVHYTRLPDWFLLFDVYDHAAGRFWSADRRDRLAAESDLATVPRLTRGRFDLQGLRAMLGPSRFGDGPAEGICVRRDRGGYLEQRAKLVAPEFTETIGAHWSSRGVRPNALGQASSAAGTA